MGVCMGKENQLGTSMLAPEGRFESQQYPMENNSSGTNNHHHQRSNVRFSEPRVPVIFVLGGPGSGKITHCDRAVQERQGLAHVNMTDLIQQHVVGNALTDFTQIPAKNLIEVLLIEMKMAVNASAYIISGYPRSMRDVVEYNDKLQRVDRVVLLNWHVKILEKQIEFGAQLGDTVLQLARMELKNYNKNVLAVAEYFDQLGKLSVVDGERQPTEVYIDFLHVIDNIMASIKQQQSKQMAIPHNATTGNNVLHNHTNNPSSMIVPLGPLHIIWIIGGPGSNKSTLASNSSPYYHLSMGHELRMIVAKSREMNTTVFTPEEIRGMEETMSKGDLVSNDIIIRIISSVIATQRRVVIDGFPRNPLQLKSFHDLTNTTPPCILLDCSEVNLGISLGQRKSRSDDRSPAAIKTRLEIYRTVTLPTLKTLDDHNRLYIVDGDGDKESVMVEFNTLLNSVMHGVENGGVRPTRMPGNVRKPSVDTLKGMYLEVDE